MRKKRYPPEGFGDRLHHAFMYSGYTVRALSERTGIPTGTLYHYLYYGQDPCVGNFAAICKALNVSADYLIFGEEKK